MAVHDAYTIIETFRAALLEERNEARKALVDNLMMHGPDMLTKAAAKAGFIRGLEKADAMLVEAAKKVSGETV